MWVFFLFNGLLDVIENITEWVEHEGDSTFDESGHFCSLYETLLFSLTFYVFLISAFWERNCRRAGNIFCVGGQYSMCHGPLCLPNPTPRQKGKLSLFFVKITWIPDAESRLECGLPTELSALHCWDRGEQRDCAHNAACFSLSILVCPGCSNRACGQPLEATASPRSCNIWESTSLCSSTISGIKNHWDNFI